MERYIAHALTFESGEILRITGKPKSRNGPAGSKEVAWLHTATYSLSPREEEVVEYVVRGASTRQISQALYITEDTVQKHLQNAFEKVGVRSRRALVKRLYLNTIFP